MSRHQLAVIIINGALTLVLLELKLEVVCPISKYYHRTGHIIILNIYNMKTDNLTAIDFVILVLDIVA